ncbi:Plasmodium exported protein, unknown function [Plasmodium knowlesi strain H]|uniref:Plasmodium RESA N-terminal domain-containing protein n=3 Tax=Plasmodium knowlesi TaxID=5850 RepID=A0A5K1TY34_PLAKH|nr:Plasmodium exported protein, unknown function [Plasmodium knowlesi strain H]OTN64560.1 Uncharacterized protein PKNOH_S130166900 [Plasmodium knowlesi]CAA9988842.1 Plasmodium exported protein, unknown function [Plasmodium knowlesi strain H]SBO24666.1 Plasmodium exported protein, unknown function [Plasmodium knowlesi strain H]SBO27951.1 Plasmodium exported protein, unknown function [Plasmodium knowlesi strain H]VVS78316.1 Plasmodium exported protein, unknown function [Plasmodium knowlesi strai|eukprot:XP_002261188.1 hypothetical protein, conserved in Plasmodium species [Plasmodium knowlesi strain H]
MININTNSKNETHGTRKKESTPILTLYSIVNFNRKNVRVVKVTSFLSFVLLSFLFLNCHFFIRNGKKYNNNAVAFQSELSLPNGRILATNETFNEEEKNFFTFKDENDEKLRRDDSPYLKVYTNINDLNDLSVKSSEIWKKVIQNMKDYYYKETVQMDDRWRDFMWTMKWKKHYIQNVHSMINKVLQDLNNPITEKEKIINTWLQISEQDLEFFLKCVKEQWHKVVSDQLKKTIQDVKTTNEVAKDVENQLDEKKL